MMRFVDKATPIRALYRWQVMYNKAEKQQEPITQGPYHAPCAWLKIISEACAHYCGLTRGFTYCIPAIP